MKPKKIFSSLYLTAILFPILISLSAKAETIPVKDELIKSKTLLAQSESSSQVLVTGVEVNSTDNGIEIILNTFSNQIFESIITTEDNNLIIDILNTQLQLSEKNEFLQENPTQDIASVNVTNVEPNTIRVTIVGRGKIPTAEVLNNESGLVISVTPEQNSEDDNIEIIATGEP